MKVSSHATRNCPCCGNQTTTALLNNQMAAIGGLDMSYTIGSCRQCGFLYACELPPNTSYSYYYRTLSKYDQITSASHISIVDRIRADATIALCAPHLDPASAIADLGCGVGYLLHSFKDAGWHELYGLDPAPSAPQQALSLFDLTGVRNGILSDATRLLPVDRIKLYCLTGVLEHLWSPREELLSLFGQLKPGTLILIEVPALEHFSRQPNEPFGEFSLEHIQYFSQQSLCRMFAQLGAEAIHTSILDLGNAATDSLLCLFRINGKSAYTAQWSSSNVNSDMNALALYIAQSARAQEDAIARLAEAPRPWIIYGAGSHTARLLPILANRGLDKHILAIMDGNANLYGQEIGRWTIQPPSELARHPKATVIISSFRAQAAIAAALSERLPNRLLYLYPNNNH